MGTLTEGVWEGGARESATKAAVINMAFKMDKELRLCGVVVGVIT